MRQAHPELSQNKQNTSFLGRMANLMQCSNTVDTILLQGIWQLSHDTFLDSLEKCRPDNSVN